MNKNGIVDIFGGFGNQIFQFCFANSLKNKNLSITINTRDFERVARENSPLLTARKLVLPVEYFDFDETTNKEFKSYKFKKLISESKFTKKITNQNILIIALHQLTISRTISINQYINVPCGSPNCLKLVWNLFQNRQS